MASIGPNTKIVLITGANQGIGYQMAKQLTSQHKGYHVLMGARSISRGEAAASELQNQGLSVEPIQIDVTDDASITAAASQVKSKFGHLDVLINNAGIAPDENFSPTNPSRDVFQKVFNTNVFGAFVVTEAFTPLLNASPLPHPQVQFTSSGLGSLTNYVNKLDFSDTVLPAYRSSKAAVNMLCLHFNHVGKERGWEVNANCPGFVATSINGYSGTGSAESGAINAVRLVVEGGVSGTYSNKEGTIPW